MQDVVGRFGGTLTARDEIVALIVENRFHDFVFVRRALENSLGLQRRQVKAIEKRMFALRPGARSVQQNRVAGLNQGPLSSAASAATTAAPAPAATTAAALEHGTAGIFIAILI